MKKSKRRSISKFISIPILFVLIILSIYAALEFLKKSYGELEQYQLNYAETSKTDYQVCLKDNEFYESQCLVKDMKYVASLIKNIFVSVNYSFKTDKNVNSDFTYSIIGKLIISDSDSDSNVIFSKNYDLLEEKKAVINNNDFLNINENLIINYGEYNTLANKFKSTYGISSNARLELHMIIKNNGNLVVNNNFKYNIDKDLIISIPLSQNSINININYSNLNSNETITYRANKANSNVYYTILAVIMVCINILSIILLFMIMFTPKNKKSKYERVLKKILNDYDRLIVEGKNKINIKDYDVVLVKKFSELVDVRDNLMLPIIYNERIKDIESLFYIKDEDKLYIYILNAREMSE